MTTTDGTDWTYDAEAGAGYLSLRPGRVTSSEAAGELFVVDFGQDDETLGIEVLSSVDAALIDAWLARVRRDAAREAMEGLASDFDLMGSQEDGPEVARWIRAVIDTEYPEETP